MNKAFKKKYIRIFYLISLLLIFVWQDAFAIVRKVPTENDSVIFSYAPLVKNASPAVVNIYTRKKVKTLSISPFFDDPFFKRFFGNDLFGGGIRERVQSSLGSGVLVTTNGLVVTSAHVVSGSDEITVVLSDRREFDAKITLSDNKTDLALLQIDAKGEKLPFLSIGDSDELEVGDIVIAIGNPFGVGQTVTSGIVSAVARTTLGVADYQFFIQTDAAINPGNSGGALIDMTGKMVGVNTAIYTRSGGSNGIGFAIPANMVKAVMRSATHGGKIIRPWLGVAMQKVTQDIASSMGLKKPVGAIVSKVYDGSPAARSGLRAGDIVIAIDGKEAVDEHALRFRIATYDIGGKAVLTVLRNGKEKFIAVEMLPPPEIPPRDERELKGNHPLAGAKIANLSPAVAEEMELDYNETGVVVVDVGSGNAMLAGIKEGDIIMEVNDEKIGSAGKLEKLISSNSYQWKIKIKRSNNIITVVWK